MSANTLLHQVSTISKKYEEIKKITGEDFNIFKVLKVERKEVQTHSAFLSELLNSEGTHGLQDYFLNIFLQLQIEKQNKHSIFCNKVIAINPAKSRAIPEFYIGPLSPDQTEGGKIDILIKDNSKNAVIIENKIDAGDQFNQLERYNKAFPESAIFYLTLQGTKPPKESFGKLIEGENYICISYKEDILKWLIQCHKEAATYPLLRETISQYINLIKYLTGKTMNDNMKTEIVDAILRNPESFISAHEISKALPDVFIQLIDKYLEHLDSDPDFKSIINAKFDSTLQIDRVKKQISLNTDSWSHKIVFYFGDNSGNEMYVTVENSIPANNSKVINVEKIKNIFEKTFEGTQPHKENIGLGFKSKIQTWSPWENIEVKERVRETKEIITTLLDNLKECEL